MWNTAYELHYQWIGQYITPYRWIDASENKGLNSFLASLTTMDVSVGGRPEPANPAAPRGPSLRRMPIIGGNLRAEGSLAAEFRANKTRLIETRRVRVDAAAANVISGGCGTRTPWRGGGSWFDGVRAG